jgi:hypothetical protein
MHKRKDEFLRFIEKVNKTDTCWLWTGAKYRRGYGHFGRWIDNVWRMYKTHRYAYEYFKGPIPDGLLVLHKCDNPACVNPEHLFVGTYKENTQDMLQKGRFGYPRNPEHNHLDFEFAQWVRAYAEVRTMKQKDIAKIFNISTAQTSRILNNKIWREQ